MDMTQPKRISKPSSSMEEQHEEQPDLQPRDKIMMILSVIDDQKGEPSTVEDTVDLSLDHVHPIEVRQKLQAEGFKSLELSFNADRIVNKDNDEEWKTKKDKTTKLDTETLKLLTNISSLSAVGITTNLIASHILTAASVCLAIRENLVIWIKYPYKKIKDHKDSVYWTSAKIWYDGTVKRRSYSGILLHGKHFGLSPAMQQAEITSTDEFEKYGLELKYADASTELSADTPIPYLQMSFRKIITNPTKNNLEKLEADEYVEPTNVVSRMLGHLYGRKALEKFPDAFKEEDVEEGLLDAIHNDPNYQPIHYRHPAVNE